MKLVQSYVLIALSCGTLSRAFSIFSHGGDDHVQTRLGSSDDTSDRRLIELSPGESQWVTEEEKWGLKRVYHSIFHQYQDSYLYIVFT